MRNKLINVVTLGCSKNLVDSEYLMKQLQAGGYQIVHDSDKTEASIVIINTCGFIQDAKQESINTILEFAQAKSAGKIDKLYVMGCLSERYKPELKKEIPEADEFFGVNNMKDVLKDLQVDYKKELTGERLLTTPAHYAYLKISEGCNRKCSFCAIPLIRGKHISRPVEEIVAEATHLAAQGTKELILIAQDLSSYGLDLYKKPILAELLEKLSAIKGMEWIRLHYAFPASFPNEVIEVMKNHDNICKYLDIPFQHISNHVLKDMRRGIDKNETYSLIKYFREQIPGIALRTTLLVGHPGETDEDFEELKDFVQATRFDRLGIFPYSPEEGTWAYKHYPDNVPDALKQQRADEIMAIQAEISNELNREKVGKIFKILVDREVDDYYIGRTEFDSPEVDDEVLIAKNGKKLTIGNFYPVKIVSSSDFELTGELAS